MCKITFEMLLTCGLKDAVGVDVYPIFSWIPKIESDADVFGKSQSAYQIQLSKEAACLWDSGKVLSEELQGIYNGPALQSGTSYSWKVRIWDEADDVSQWSEAACFTTGIVCAQDWAAKWINAGMPKESRVAPVFRRSFSVEKGLKDAVLHICGLGLYTLEINGRSADDSLLNPANTQFDVRALYRTYCVKDRLFLGENAVTVELGNGFYNEDGGVWNWQTASWRAAPKLLFQLELSYTDGRKEYILSDESWEVTMDGPVRTNGIYAGEAQDARCLFERAAWKQACLTEAPNAALSAQLMEPIRRLNTYAPAHMTRLEDGGYIITAPEMMTGWAKLRLNIPDGDAVTVLYGETLEKDGHVTRVGKNEGNAGQWWPDYYIQCDTFIGNGALVEFEPRYSYKGFRYIEVSGYDGQLKSEDVTLYRIGNDIAECSLLNCSEQRVMQLHEMMRRTLRNNFQGKPTDTPVWEKNGWLGDVNVSLGSILNNYGILPFFKEFARTMEDCLHLYGLVPIMVPTARWGVDNQVVWTSAFPLTVAGLYNHFGGKAYLSAIYGSLLQYADGLVAVLKENNWRWGSHDLTDWVCPVGRPELPVREHSPEGSAICATAFAYRALTVIADMGRCLNRNQEAEKYSAAADLVLEHFSEAFYQKENCLYDTGSWNDLNGQAQYRSRYRQTSNLLPLAFHMVPEGEMQKVAARLAKEVEKKGHLDTGCVGTPFVLPVLADMGRPDLAYRVLMQDTYPSWGYWISRGADTMWESWEDTTRSRDHYFLGTCEEFFYTHIVGVRDVRDGWRSFTVRPCMTEYIRSAGAAWDTVRGKAECRWQRDTYGLRLDITVPFGAEAILELPGTTESRKLQSGHYTFFWEIKD